MVRAGLLLAHFMVLSWVDSEPTPHPKETAQTDASPNPSTQDHSQRLVEYLYEKTQSVKF